MHFEIVANHQPLIKIFHSINQHLCLIHHATFKSNLNKSVENAGVAFVKGADERNKFFEKINNR